MSILFRQRKDAQSRSLTPLKLYPHLVERLIVLSFLLEVQVSRAGLTSLTHLNVSPGIPAENNCCFPRAAGRWEDIAGSWELDSEQILREKKKKT